jgi:hypothetical protein
MNESLLIIGNGPSTKKLLDYGFHNIPPNIDTISTSSAFKYCKTLNWWPTYYVLADPKMVLAKQSIIQSLIVDPEIPTQKFYLCLNKIKAHKLEFYDPYEKIQNCDHIESGTAAIRIALSRRNQYKNIGIIGIDNNYNNNNSWGKYKDHFISASDKDNRVICVKDIGSHPSYFWPNYIEKGDIITWVDNPGGGSLRTENQRVFLTRLTMLKKKIYNFTLDKINLIPPKYPYQSDFKEFFKK